MHSRDPLISNVIVRVFEPRDQVAVRKLWVDGFYDTGGSR